MKTFTIILSFLFLQQFAQASHFGNDLKAEKSEKDSLAKKLYNLHIVRNFPNIDCDRQVLYSIDDSSPVAPGDLYYAPNNNPLKKSPITNLKWTTPKK
jgi:hypothetical protein